MGAEANQRNKNEEKNSDIIRETSRRVEEICKANEEINITNEEAIRDDKEPKRQVDT